MIFFRRFSPSRKLSHCRLFLLKRKRKQQHGLWCRLSRLSRAWHRYICCKLSFLKKTEAVVMSLRNLMNKIFSLKRNKIDIQIDAFFFVVSFRREDCLTIVKCLMKKKRKEHDWWCHPNRSSRTRHRYICCKLIFLEKGQAVVMSLNLINEILISKKETKDYTYVQIDAWFFFVAKEKQQHDWWCHLDRPSRTRHHYICGKQKWRKSK